jgi:hypothetical protein
MVVRLQLFGPEAVFQRQHPERPIPMSMAKIIWALLSLLSLRYSPKKSGRALALRLTDIHTFDERKEARKGENKGSNQQANQLNECEMDRSRHVQHPSEPDRRPLLRVVCPRLAVVMRGPCMGHSRERCRLKDVAWQCHAIPGEVGSCRCAAQRSHSTTVPCKPHPAHSTPHSTPHTSPRTQHPAHSTQHPHPKHTTAHTAREKKLKLHEMVHKLHGKVL